MESKQKQFSMKIFEKSPFLSARANTAADEEEYFASVSFLSDGVSSYLRSIARTGENSPRLSSGLGEVGKQWNGA